MTDNREDNVETEAECLSTGVKLSDLPARVRDLVDSVRRSPGVNPKSAKGFLEGSSITPEDLVHWAEFDHPDADSYGRRLVWDGGCFELMVMSWVDGDMAAIHDHGYTQWGAVKLFGPAEHAIFKMRDGRLTTSERCDYEAGDVVAVGHDLIHQMGNMGQKPFLSLHLYGCYGREGDITADARLYELDAGVIQRTSGGVFFGLPEEDVQATEPNLRADAPTTLRHKVERLRRAVTASGSRQSGELQDEAAERLTAELTSRELWSSFGDDLAAFAADDSSLGRRSSEIARRELTATCDLLIELSSAGLLSDPLTDGLSNLAGESPDARAEAFAGRIADRLGVELPLPVAAA
ncbi:MAG: cysteine dioxygenase family protein [Acidobacteriota bacterium]